MYHNMKKIGIIVSKIAEGSYLGHTVLGSVVCQERIDELS